jgi:hypothetical protein
MITLTTTIQEITMQAYTFGVFNYLFEREHNAMSRDEIFNLFEKWGEEFEALEKEHEGEDDWFYYDEIDEFINKKYMELKLEDAFPFGIAVGDHISYEGGIYLITGITDRGIAVDEVKPGKDPGWIVTEIGFSQHDKIKILPDYEEIMDTTQNHDAELVRKINQAWNEKREQFCPILRALYARDIKEIMDSDAWNWTDDEESVKETLHDEWDFHADNYLMHIADDLDLKAILTFLRYKV